MIKEKQIEKMTETINDLYGADAMYYGVDSYGIATTLYNAGYRKQEWISVEDRLPEIGGTYLITLKEKYAYEDEWNYHVDVASYSFDWDCTFNDWDEGQEIHITHWMPLPEAPKMKGGE